MYRPRPTRMGPSFSPPTSLPLSSVPPYLQNGSVAVGAAWDKQLMVVLLAVGPPIVLEGGDRGQLLLALGAGKVLWVPGFAHGVDHLAKDGTVAGGTHTLGGAEK